MNEQAVLIASADRALEAEFVPSANMVCASLRFRGAELLYAAHGLDSYLTAGKTLGIPLLHPWANRLAGPTYCAAGAHVSLPAADGRYPTDPNGLPIHGAIPSLLRWELGSHAADALLATLDWDAPELLELFPFPHRLELSASLTARSLTLATVVTAGERSVPVSFGWHPYLILPGVPRAAWRVSLGARDKLVLDQRLIPTGQVEPLAEREFVLAEQSWDDGLSGLDPRARFAVSGGGLELSVTFDEGYPFAQIYAPPAHDLICFEPMTAPTNALVSGASLTVLQPHARYRAAFTVAVTEN